MMPVFSARLCTLFSLPIDSQNFRILPKQRQKASEVNSSLMKELQMATDEAEFIQLHLEECLKCPVLKEELIKRIYQKPNALKALDEMLTRLLKGVQEDKFESMVNFLQDFLPTDKELINQWISLKSEGRFASVNEAIQYQVIDSPTTQAQPSKSLVKAFFAQWKRDWPIFIKSIINLINLFIDTLNFLNVNKNSMSLWDRQLIMLIISKFFLIPSLLAQMLRPFLGTLVKSYLVAYSIIALSSLAIYVYQRWLRPPVQNISKAENKKEAYQKGELKHRVVQKAAVKELGSALQTQNVLIIGPSGAGKTSYIDSFVKTAVEEEKIKDRSQAILPEDVRKRQIQGVDCKAIMHGKSYNKAENIEELKKEIAGYESQTLLTFDEVQSFIHDPACFEALKPLLDRKDLRCIAMTTPEGYEKIKKEFDQDLAFTDRWFVIRMDSATDKQIENILIDVYQERIKTIFKNTGIHILIENDAIKEAIQQAKKTFPNKAQPRNAIHCLEDLITRCQNAYSSTYFIPKLEELKGDLELRRKQCCVYEQEMPDLSLAEKEEIASLEQEEKKRKDAAKEIQSKRAKDLAYKKECFKLSQNSHFKARAKLQASYILYHYYARPAVQSRMDDQVKQWQGKMDFRLDSVLIQKYFKEKADEMSKDNVK